MLTKQDEKLVNRIEEIEKMLKGAASTRWHKYLDTVFDEDHNTWDTLSSADISAALDMAEKLLKSANESASVTPSLKSLIIEQLSK